MKQAGFHGGNFATGVSDNGGKFATGINDTGGKFGSGTTDVVDTCGNLPVVSKAPAVNLPPVPMMLVANNGNLK
jgi:hypothetical protein